MRPASHTRLPRANCEGAEGQIERITRCIRLTGDLDEKQAERLIQIADRCPAHRTLETGPVISTLEDK